jgi:nucleotide-binding universal stress UspA family protein
MGLPPARRPVLKESKDLAVTGRAALPRSLRSRQRRRRYGEDDMNARRTVVVGVDGSAEVLRAVRWAVPEARRHQAVLRLITAFAWSDDRPVGLPGLGQAPCGEYLRTAAEKGLAAAAAAAADVDPDLPVEQELVLGLPADVLHEQSQTAELLVVGDSGRGRIASALIGSTALSVAARSACPVVVVRGVPTTAEGPLPVVVGIDGTPLSEAAIAFAFDAAAGRSVSLVAVHTWRDEINDPALVELVDWQAAAEQAEEVLAERLAGWAEKYPDVQVRRLVARGRAAHVLLDQAPRAQLVVVGSRGLGEIAGLVLDSVSNALVHKANCPVAIVRGAG